ncbi:MAG: hypothetical protein NXI24_24190 [bacterium]|nr:hypothetical protein [bacterium]
MLAIGFASACKQRDCPPDSACVTVAVNTYGLEEEFREPGAPCKRSFAIQGSSRENPDDTIESTGAVIGEYMGTMPPVCLHELEFDARKIGPWRIELTYADGFKTACNFDLVGGPLINYIQFFPGLPECMHGAGPGPDAAEE